MMDVARNDPCPCGSGLKYKKCCLQKGDVESNRRYLLAGYATLGVLALAVALGYLVGRGTGVTVAVVGALVLGLFLLFGDPPSSRRGGGDPGAINFGR